MYGMVLRQLHGCVSAPHLACPVMPNIRTIWGQPPGQMPLAYFMLS